MADGKSGAPRGHPRYGGRVAGTKNVATRLREQAMVEALLVERLTPEQLAELTPLAVMLRIMRSAYQVGDKATAAAMAAMAAPYCHAKLTPSSDPVIVHHEADERVHFFLPPNGRDRAEELDGPPVIEGAAEEAAA